MATANLQEVSEARPSRPPGRVEGAPKEKRPKRGIVLAIAAVLVLLAGTWAVRKWSYGRSHESTENAQVDGHLVPVLSKVSGYVSSVNADENTHVESGTPIVIIDDAEYRVRLAQAEADLAAAQAAAGTHNTTGQAEAQVQTATGQRAALSAQIDAARANATKAHADLTRFRELADKQIVSRQQLDAAQAAAEAADANVVALEQQAAAAGASVTNAQAGVRLADARLQAARAARDNAQLQLQYTRIEAPTSGIVSRKQVEVGQLVQAGQPLLTIVADTGAWVTANFKETQLADIRVGQQVEIEVDTYGGATAKGVVESVAAATGAKFALLPPDNATGNFTKVVQRVPVRIRITEGLGKDRPLRPGMSVTAHVAVR
jgi:membrane fusion protein (multidrug efflux system)